MTHSGREATRCSVWYCLGEAVATRGGPGWLCRKHADEYDESGWGEAPASGRKATADQLYCGCCGNEIGRSTRSDPDWCNRCARHVARSYRGYTRLAVWDRTYFARTGESCPFQVPPPARETTPIDASPTSE